MLLPEVTRARLPQAVEFREDEATQFQGQRDTAETMRTTTLISQTIPKANCSIGLAMVEEVLLLRKNIVPKPAGSSR